MTSQRDSYQAISSDKVHIATIGAPFGVRGAFRLKTTTEIPENALSYGDLCDHEGRNYRFQILRVENENTLVVTEPSILDRTAADSLKGIKLFTHASNLPPLQEDDTFYASRLVGLSVCDRDKKPLGTVTNILNFGASDILEVKTADGKKQIPFTKDAVLEVDIENHFLQVDPAFLI